jgi:signal transduction histidine kinase/DNA-binding NarL/FixJ family response regulator
MSVRQTLWEKQVNLIHQTTGVSAVCLMEFAELNAKILASSENAPASFTYGKIIPLSHPFIKNIQVYKKEVSVINQANIEGKDIDDDLLDIFQSIIVLPVYTCEKDLWGALIVFKEKSELFSEKLIENLKAFAIVISEQLKLQYIPFLQPQKKANVNFYQQLKFLLELSGMSFSIISSEGDIIFDSSTDVKNNKNKCYFFYNKKPDFCRDCPLSTKNWKKTTLYHSSGDTYTQITCIPFVAEDGKWYLAEVRANYTDKMVVDKEAALFKNQLEFSMNAGNIAFFEYNLANFLVKTNPEFEQLTGYAFHKKNVDLNWILSRIYPEDIHRVIFKFISSAKRNKQKVDIEFRLLNHENTYLWMHFVGQIEKKDTDLSNAKISGILMDITNFKKLLNDLVVERNRSLKASETKSMFLANMSHEIRTPMNAIIGFSELMSKHVQDQPLLTKYLDSIKGSGKILLSLINDLLDLAKIESGKTTVDNEQADFVQLLHEIEQTFLLIAQEKNITLRIHSLSDFPQNIYIDTLKIKQILINLINNALKFTASGKVTIAYSFKEIGNTNKGTLTFAVSDTGPGIAKDKQAKIFEPFVQYSQSREKEIKGTGLGLSIVQQLVHLLGGQISLHSEKNKGSTFSINIQNVEKCAVKHPKKEEASIIPSVYNKELILIADDTESNLELLSAYCADMNLSFELARNGNEVIQAIKKRKPHLIFMDIRMPIMDGYQTVKLIKTDDSTKDIHVIAVSASSLHSKQELIVNAGFDCYITKPIEDFKLKQILAKFLKHNKTTIPEKEIEVAENSFLLDTGKAQHLLAEINCKVVPVLNDLKSIISSESLQRFNHEIKQLVHHINWPELESYSKELRLSIETYDYETIQVLIHKFDNFINHLKNNY